MAVLSKAQLTININADPTLTAGQKTILIDMVSSYQDLFPQITTLQRNALTPGLGQVIFNTDNSRYEYWNGVVWFAIGQDLSTPLTVKIDLTSAEILALDTVAKVLVAAPGAGFAVVPNQLTYRYIRGSASYAGSYNIALISSTKTTGDSLGTIGSTIMNGGGNRSGVRPIDSAASGDTIVENDSIVLKSSGAITTGDGILSVWLTYSIIAW